MHALPSGQAVGKLAEVERLGVGVAVGGERLIQTPGSVVERTRPEQVAVDQPSALLAARGRLVDAMVNQGLQCLTVPQQAALQDGNVSVQHIEAAVGEQAEPVVEPTSVQIPSGSPLVPIGVITITYY